MRAAIAVLAACAHAVPVDPPSDRADRTRAYTIWLGGARIGTAVETETWSATGVRLVRDERMRFLRGDAVVELATAIDIDADRALRASRVRWAAEVGTDDAGGRPVGARAGEHGSSQAVRDTAGWLVDSGRRLPADATPAELVPLIVRRDGGFAGDVFLPARGFVVGRGRIAAVAPRRLVARLALDGGTLALATIDLDADGAPARIVDGDGVIALRATAEQAAAPFPVVDLIRLSAIAIDGTHSRELRLDGDVALPPLPGQRARLVDDSVIIELDARLPGALAPVQPSRDRRADIAALVAAVRARITPDLAAPPSPRDPGAATAGDCTTYALAYAALAAQRGIATRVVTGFRVDENRLIRHRWAVSWTGSTWIAVDAAFGAAPAGGDLVGLAVHDADDAGLVAGEAALTAVRSASWR